MNCAEKDNFSKEKQKQKNLYHLIGKLVVMNKLIKRKIKCSIVGKIGVRGEKESGAWICH